MATDFTSKNIQKFYCEKCDFKCYKKGDYNRHILTSKHLNDNKINKKTYQNITPNYKCVTCNKKFNDRSGLWRHNKKCPNQNYENEETSEIENYIITPELILNIIQQNQEFKDLLVEQNKQKQTK